MSCTPTAGAGIRPEACEVETKHGDHSFVDKHVISPNNGAGKGKYNKTEPVSGGLNYWLLAYLNGLTTGLLLITLFICVKYASIFMELLLGKPITAMRLLKES